MTKRTEHLGNDSGHSSDKHLSPQNPQTGDGRTTRQPHDRVENVQRDSNGNKI